MGSLCIQRPSERERGERQRQRKMKVTVVLFAACVASLRAAAVFDASSSTPASTTTLAQCAEDLLDVCCGITTAGSTEASSSPASSTASSASTASTTSTT